MLPVRRTPNPSEFRRLRHRGRCIRPPGYRHWRRSTSASTFGEPVPECPAANPDPGPEPASTLGWHPGSTIRGPVNSAGTARFYRPRRSTQNDPRAFRPQWPAPPRTSPHDRRRALSRAIENARGFELRRRYRQTRYRRRHTSECPCLRIPGAVPPTQLLAGRPTPHAECFEPDFPRLPPGLETAA